MPDRPNRESKKASSKTAPPAGQTASVGRKARGAKNGAAAGSGGSAKGGSAKGGSAKGGSAKGGSAKGGSAKGGSAKGGSAKGGSAGGAASRGRGGKRAAPVAPAEAAAPVTAAEAGTRSPAGLSVPAQTVPMKRAGGPAVRTDIRKTYKLFVGGAFPRTESGRSYPVTGPDGGLLAHAARASRKDARDAVVAARKAVAGWSGATAYNRGQVLYRVAEVLEGRAAQFAAECVRAEGLAWPEAERTVAEAVDRWVWYAGWPDKVAQVTGAANPVAGPYFNFSVPEPTGVVAVVAPSASGLLGLVSVLAPVIATGNCARRQRDRAAARDLAVGGARHLGRPGRGRERADRLHVGTRAGARGAHGRECDRSHRGGAWQPGRA
jgi:hypothetical protein